MMGSKQNGRYQINSSKSGQSLVSAQYRAINICKNSIGGVALHTIETSISVGSKTSHRKETNLLVQAHLIFMWHMARLLIPKLTLLTALVGGRQDFRHLIAEGPCGR
jgi:hypothetical protein